MAQGTTDRAIYVIATTPDGTERALHEARQRAVAAAQIVLIVPAIVPDGSTSADTAHLIAEFGALAAQAGVRPPFVCVCRHAREVLTGFPMDGSTLIIVGGPSGSRSEPSPERDLARFLALDGHHVAFADLGADDADDLDEHAGPSSDEG